MNITNGMRQLRARKSFFVEVQIIENKLSISH